MIVVNTDAVPGYEIVDIKGMVQGNTTEKVRVNALGAIRFLMPDSADLTKALMKRLGTEKDSDIRYQLVETLEWNLIGQGEKGRQELTETFRKLLKSEAQGAAPPRVVSPERRVLLRLQGFDAGHSDGACVCVEITKDKRRIEKPMKIAVFIHRRFP